MNAHRPLPDRNPITPGYFHQRDLRTVPGHDHRYHRQRPRAGVLPVASLTSSTRASLRSVSTTVLEQLRSAISSGVLRAPVDRTGLVGFGLRHQLDAIERALAGHKSAACVAIFDVALAEREDTKPTPELVWTGPEAPAGFARDTAVVLRALFEGARESVVLAGYRFDHARDVLAPLHASMRDHRVDARFLSTCPRSRRAPTPPATSPSTSTASSTPTGPSASPAPASTTTSARSRRGRPGAASTQSHLLGPYSNSS